MAARINERILKHVVRLKPGPVGTDPLRARRHSHLLAACRDIAPNEMQIAGGRREDNIVNRSAGRNKSLGGARIAEEPRRGSRPPLQSTSTRASWTPATAGGPDETRRTEGRGGTSTFVDVAGGVVLDMRAGIRRRCSDAVASTEDDEIVSQTLAG